MMRRRRGRWSRGGGRCCCGGRTRGGVREGWRPGLGNFSLRCWWGGAEGEGGRGLTSSLMAPLPGCFGRWCGLVGGLGGCCGVWLTDGSFRFWQMWEIRWQRGEAWIFMSDLSKTPETDECAIGFSPTECMTSKSSDDAHFVDRGER